MLCGRRQNKSQSFRLNVSYFIGNWIVGLGANPFASNWRAQESTTVAVCNRYAFLAVLLPCEDELFPRMEVRSLAMSEEEADNVHTKGGIREILNTHL